jgi:basic membrane lipoprotein Med (substrate-binding protein (PBP1-ABC) superfamily)
MKKHKKILILFLCGIMGLGLLSFAGCGDGAEWEHIGGFVTSDEEEDPFPLFTRIGFIYETCVERGTLTAMFERSRFELERTLGVETRYMENVLLQQFDDAVDKLIEGGCNVIVAASNRYNSAIIPAARRNLNVHFISFGSSDEAYNLSSIQPLLFHAANVNGFLAAFNTYSNKIGIVADQNMYHAQGIVSAFALGARELTHSDVEISLNWTLSTRISDTYRAIDDLIAQGCDIIFFYQADVSGIRRAEELGVKTMGFAHDLPVIAEDNYLTGMFLNMNSNLIDIVRTIMYGNFTRSLDRGGFNEGVVNIIRLNEELLNEGSATLAERLISFIADGSSPVFSGEVRDRGNTIRLRKGEVLPINSVFAISWLPENITVEKFISPPLVQEELIFSTLEILQ